MTTTVTLTDVSALAGVPRQGSLDIPYADVALITGDTPDVVTQDLLFANNQTIPARTPVGYNSSDLLVPATYSAAAAASDVITFTGVGTANDTVTIGARTYTLVAALTAANQVLIGGSATATAANLAAAINAGAGSGTTYGTGTVAHPDVSASPSGAAVTVTALVKGNPGNDIDVSETSSAASWAAGEFTGGLNSEQGAIRPVGITVVDLVTATSGANTGAPVYRGGCFNPDKLNWPASYDTDAKKFAAFEGAPTPTNIIIRRPKTYKL